MMTRAIRPIKISFPFGLYLKQLFSANTYVRSIDPFNFWRRYRISHLETCRELNTVKYLEQCHQLKWRSPRLLNINRNTEYIDISAYPLRQLDLNRAIVSHPTIELKYRGVTYHTRDLANVNIDRVKRDSSAIESDSREQSSCNNANTPEKFGTN